MMRRRHRMMGALLILPFLGWATTGLVFFIKPGYRGAYAIPAVKTYPTHPQEIPKDLKGLEFRYLRTILGEHLLVRDENGMHHLDPTTGDAMAAPKGDRLKRLLEDALTVDPERYGSIQSLTDQGAVTDTGVRLSLNWSTLSLSQQGRDTDLINGLYEIHYLRWTGIKAIDRVLGIVGLVLLIAMTISGVILLVQTRPRRSV